MKAECILLICFVLLSLIDNGNCIRDKKLLNKLGLDNYYDIYVPQESTVKNKKCAEQSVALLKGLEKHDLWAIKMLDASSKIGSGLLTGNFYELGAFDECLSINHDDPSGQQIKGQYCLAVFNISRTIFPKVDLSNRNVKNFLLRWSICIPSACSASDIQMHLTSAFRNRGLNMNIIVNPSLCQTSESRPFTKVELFSIILLASIFVAVVAGTIYESVCVYKSKEAKSKSLLAFSLISNGRDLLKVTTDKEQLLCLHGLRIVSTVLVLLCHRFGQVRGHFPVINYFEMVDWSTKFPHMFLVGMSVVTDTFLLLSGTLLCYVFLKQMDKIKKLNIPLYYLHRFLRLTPSLAVVLLIETTLLYRAGSGPLWPAIIGTMKEKCENLWWATLLYIQNYINPGQMCMVTTWYLAVDTQLFWLSPLILIPLQKWPKYGILQLIVLVVISISVAFNIAWKNRLEAGYYTYNAVQAERFKVLSYRLTHTRAATWLIGLGLGFLLYNLRGKRIFIKKSLVILGWTLSISVMLTILFTMYIFQHPGYVYEPLFAVSYIAFSRTIWVLALSWVIVACTHGYGGPVTTFLTWSPFQILGKLSYSVFLIHSSVQFFLSASLRSAVHYSNLEVIYQFCGDLMFTLFFAVILTLGCEFPFNKLESILIQKLMKNKSKQKNDGELVTHENKKTE